MGVVEVGEQESSEDEEEGEGGERRHCGWL